MLFDKVFGLFVECGVEGFLASALEGVDLTVVRIVGRRQADAGVMVVLVVPIEEAAAERLSSWIEPKRDAVCGWCFMVSK